MLVAPLIINDTIIELDNVPFNVCQWTTCIHSALCRALGLKHNSGLNMREVAASLKIPFALYRELVVPYELYDVPVSDKRRKLETIPVSVAKQVLVTLRDTGRVEWPALETL